MSETTIRRRQCRQTLSRPRHLGGASTARPGPARAACPRAWNTGALSAMGITTVGRHSEDSIHAMLLYDGGQEDAGTPRCGPEPPISFSLPRARPWRRRRRHSSRRRRPARPAPAWPSPTAPAGPGRAGSIRSLSGAHTVDSNSLLTRFTEEAYSSRP